MVLPKGIFFSGIAGSGMSALALFMADRGAVIKGSDRLFDIDTSHRLLKIMNKRGIKIAKQDGSGIDKTTELSVFSTAVEKTNPDYVKARDLGVPIITRPEFLADIVRNFRTVAVAGTSGKSTVSGMLAYLMSALGMEPNFIGGGRVSQFRNEINQGNYLSGSSDRLVIEACESDGSLVHYYPESTIILNLDLDHHSISETGQMFRQLINHTSKRVFINGDDSNLRALNTEGAVVFAIDSQGAFKAESVNCDDLHSTFKVKGIDFHLSLPGRYNVYNALACIAYLVSEGIGLKDIARLLPDFKGIERRFQVLLNDGRGLVIDDYAHNPHKIAAMMGAVMPLRGSICYIFQPHGFGPTKLMKEGYIDVFVRYMRDTDHLILLPIYYAGGTASKDVSSDDIVQGVLKGGRSAEVMPSRDLIFDRIAVHRNFVIFGARDDSLSDYATAIAEALK